MLSIVRQSPIESNGLKLVIDRGPDIFFIPRLRSSEIESVGFFLNDQLVGFALMLSKKVMVKGISSTVLYFGNLVVGKQKRSKVLLHRMSDFYLKERTGETSFGYFLIMQGNLPAQSLLNRFHPRFPNLPHSKVIGQWIVRNIILLHPLRQKRTYRVHKARMEDIDSIVDLLEKEYNQRLFGPIITRESMLEQMDQLPCFGLDNYYIAESGNEVVGVCCAWDMAPVRRYLATGYNRRFKWTRFLLNTGGILFGYPGIPGEGAPFKEVSIIDYAVAGREPEILRSLLMNIYKEYREKNYHLMLFGHPAQDPLGAAASRFLSQSLISDIYVFSKSREVVKQFYDPSLPYIDMTLI
jgi:hypothetical protein